jgi:hypothetical protein
MAKRRIVWSSIAENELEKFLNFIKQEIKAIYIPKNCIKKLSQLLFLLHRNQTLEVKPNLKTLEV